MKLTKGTIEKFANILIRIGEAGFLGSIATIFVSNFSQSTSITGISASIVSIAIGLFINNINDK
jgi:hypothetical protein